MGVSVPILFKDFVIFLIMMPIVFMLKRYFYIQKRPEHCISLKIEVSYYYLLLIFLWFFAACDMFSPQISGILTFWLPGFIFLVFTYLLFPVLVDYWALRKKSPGMLCIWRCNLICFVLSVVIGLVISEIFTRFFYFR